MYQPKYKKFPASSGLGIIVLLACGSAMPIHAATLTSSTFTSVGLTSDMNIDLTGPNVVDWGYYIQARDFASSAGVVDNDKAVSGIGAVTVTPGAVTNATANVPDVLHNFVFNGGTAPVSGTVGAGSSMGAWAGTEDNAATIVFNDLGAGDHTVRVYVGHTSNDRIFDMDYTVTASDGNLSGNSVSNSIASGGLHSTYEIAFTTADTSADLSLQFNSFSGGAGSGWISGYVVETAAQAIPEPSSLALLGLGGLLLARRRR